MSHTLLVELVADIKLGKPLRAEDIERICALIDAKSWEAFNGHYQHGRSVYDSLQSLLSELSNPERDLVFDILEDYLIIRDYAEHALSLLQRVAANVNADNLLFSPIKDFKAGRPKSGDALAYEFYTLRRVIVDKSIDVVDTPKNPKCREEGRYHVAVDDFIGSGSQFMTMINILQNEGIDPRIQAVCAIVIQAEARQLLEASGYTVFSCIDRQKAIGDPNGRFGDNIDRAYDIYDAIEARLCCSQTYRRGYKQSEASVSMRATPNNTLPIFWYHGTKKWPAPFPRP